MWAKSFQQEMNKVNACWFLVGDAAYESASLVSTVAIVAHNRTVNMDGR